MGDRHGRLYRIRHDHDAGTGTIQHWIANQPVRVGDRLCHGGGSGHPAAEHLRHGHRAEYQLIPVLR